MTKSAANGEARGHSGIQRMALTSTMNARAIAVFILVAAIAFACMGLMTLLIYNQYRLYEEPPDSARAHAIFTAGYTMILPLALLAAGIIVASYSSNLRKAQQLKEIKRHAFVIFPFGTNMYKVYGTITQAGGKRGYSTYLDERELDAFGKL